MPKARKHQVSLDATHYYHITSRCVRRAFLCGTSRDGYCFEHRRQWMDRILKLAEIFAIETIRAIPGAPPSGRPFGRSKTAPGVFGCAMSMSP